MEDPSQLLLIVNMVCVVLVALLLRRMFKAANVFKWNPGDNELQIMQKNIILLMIVFIASTALFAAIVNNIFG